MCEAYLRRATLGGAETDGRVIYLRGDTEHPVTMVDGDLSRDGQVRIRFENDEEMTLHVSWLVADLGLLEITRALDRINGLASTPGGPGPRRP